MSNRVTVEYQEIAETGASKSRQTQLYTELAETGAPAARASMVYLEIAEDLATGRKGFNVIPSAPGRIYRRPT